MINLPEYVDAVFTAAVIAFFFAFGMWFAILVGLLFT